MTFSVTAAGLDITDPTTYELHDEGFSFNGISYTQRLVESEFMDGAIEINRTKGMVPCVMKIDVFGSTAAQAQTRIAILIDALAENGDWTLTAVINSSATYSWRCMAANSYNIGPFNRFTENNILDVEFSFLRYPVPLLGGVG